MVNRGRFTAQVDGDFVVFLIGMRINRPWKVRQWLPAFVAMPRMLRWLDQHPEAGLLAWHNAWIKGPAVVQYWRSFEQLDRFARAGDQPHLPAWKAWNQAVRASGDAGIWHETFPCTPASTSASTGTCRGWGWRSPASTFRSAQPAERCAPDRRHRHRRAGARAYPNP